VIVKDDGQLFESEITYMALESQTNLTELFMARDR